jgi:hypothetical protein
MTIFYQTSANEYYEGGRGLDTVVFTGKYNDYQINIISTNEVDVTDFGSKPNDGSDTLVSIERLDFADVTLAFDVGGAAGQGYRIYQAAFDRTPDLAGLGYWIGRLDAGLSLRDAAAGFIGSQEFRQTYGPNLSNTEFVNELYFNVLGRAGESSGLNYWVEQMAHGYSRANVLADFSESAENVGNVAPSINDGILFT